MAHTQKLFSLQTMPPILKSEASGDASSHAHSLMGLRSISVPSNLPKVANVFWEETAEELLLQDHKNGDNSKQPLHTAMEDEDFFLPFDDDGGDGGDGDHETIDVGQGPRVGEQQREQASPRPSPLLEPPKTGDNITSISASDLIRKESPKKHLADKKSRALKAQHHREKAISQLSAFFGGPPLLSNNNSSPTSVILSSSHELHIQETLEEELSVQALSKRSSLPNTSLESSTSSAKSSSSSSSPSGTGVPTPSSPKRNMFGDIIEEGKPLIMENLEESPASNHPMQEETSTLEESLPQPQHPSFTLLQPQNRANSMPVSLSQATLPVTSSAPSSSSSTRRLLRKSSLKKVSSKQSTASSTCSSSNNNDSMKPTVSFSSLSIREYNVALSDHPSCSFGPPVQLDWTYSQQHDNICLETYESTRQPRRQGTKLMLSYYDRRFLLLKQAGYSKRELQEAMQEVERVKRERMVTDFLLPATLVLDDTMETVTRTIQQLFFVKQHKPSSSDAQEDGPLSRSTSFSS